MYWHPGYTCLSSGIHLVSFLLFLLSSQNASWPSGYFIPSFNSLDSTKEPRNQTSRIPSRHDIIGCWSVLETCHRLLNLEQKIKKCSFRGVRPLIQQQLVCQYSFSACSLLFGSSPSFHTVWVFPWRLHLSFVSVLLMSHWTSSCATPIFMGVGCSQPGLQGSHFRPLTVAFCADTVDRLAEDRISSDQESAVLVASDSVWWTEHRSSEGHGWIQWRLTRQCTWLTVLWFSYLIPAIVRHRIESNPMFCTGSTVALSVLGVVIMNTVVGRERKPPTENSLSPSGNRAKRELC